MGSFLSMFSVLSHSHNCSSCIPLVWPVFMLLVVDGRQLYAGYVHRVTTKNMTVMILKVDNHCTCFDWPLCKCIMLCSFYTLFTYNII